MKLINCNKHAVTIDRDGKRITLPAATAPALVTMNQAPVGSVTVDGLTVPIYRTAYGDVTGLPDPEPGTIFLVNQIVLAALGGSRMDVLAVDGGPSALRTAAGQVDAVTQLIEG